VVAEVPEEVVETRSLYEQLQAQKEAKQLDYEEQHRLSAYWFTLLHLFIGRWLAVNFTQ